MKENKKLIEAELKALFKEYNELVTKANEELDSWKERVRKRENKNIIKKKQKVLKGD